MDSEEIKFLRWCEEIEHFNKDNYGRNRDIWSINNLFSIAGVTIHTTQLETNLICLKLRLRVNSRRIDFPDIMADFGVEKAQLMTDYLNQLLCEGWLELNRFDPLSNFPPSYSLSILFKLIASSSYTPIRNILPYIFDKSVEDMIIYERERLSKEELVASRIYTHINHPYVYMYIGIGINIRIKNMFILESKSIMNEAMMEYLQMASRETRDSYEMSECKNFAEKLPYKKQQ